MIAISDGRLLHGKHFIMKTKREGIALQKILPCRIYSIISRGKAIAVYKQQLLNDIIIAILFLFSYTFLLGFPSQNFCDFEV